MLDVGGTLFFAGDDGLTGPELWVSDGTAAGTRLILDILPGIDGSSPFPIAAAGGRALIYADDGDHGREPWVSDGTEAGTAMACDIRPGPGSSTFPFSYSFAAEALGLAGGTFLFQADDGTNGAEIWSTDGTPAGTVLVEDIAPGADGSYPHGFTDLGGVVLFTAWSPDSGYELWKTDGAGAATTEMVEDIRPGSDNATPTEITRVGNRAFFRAYDGTHGAELWVSDGTAAGTDLVEDILPGTDSPFFSGQRFGFADLAGKLLFFTFDVSVPTVAFWTSDGTAAGTSPVIDFAGAVFPSALLFSTGQLAVGPHVYFRAYGPDGLELWKTDGSAAGTGQVADITRLTSSVSVFHANVVLTEAWSVHGDRVEFPASDGLSGEEIWTSDGTEAGTSLLADLLAGEESSYPTVLTPLGPLTLFLSTEGLAGTDGTPAGTGLVTGGTVPGAAELHGLPGRALLRRFRYRRRHGVLEDRRQRGGHGAGGGHPARNRQLGAVLPSGFRGFRWHAVLQRLGQLRRHGAVEERRHRSRHPAGGGPAARPRLLLPRPADGRGRRAVLLRLRRRQRARAVDERRHSSRHAPRRRRPARARLRAAGAAIRREAAGGGRLPALLRGQ